MAVGPILVVDDEPLNLDAIREALKASYRLVFATSGSDALAATRRHKPSLILLDIQMPGMDGFELVSPYKNGLNDGTEASVDAALLGKIDLIVTTTGNVNVCDAGMLKALKKRAVVCNIGHFDNEIDTAFMRKT